MVAVNAKLETVGWHEVRDESHTTTGEPLDPNQLAQFGGLLNSEHAITNLLALMCPDLILGDDPNKATGVKLGKEVVP